MKELQHGCRAEYGALELRVQKTVRLNGFIVYVEDPRLDHVKVYEHPELNTLEAAKDHAVLKADEYLNSHQEPPPDAPEWRCS